MRGILALFLSSALLLTSCTATEEPTRTMPAFTGSFADMAEDFYRITWTDDGYPARDDGFEHPLYPIYVLNNFMGQYEAEPTEELRDAIATVARAAVERMEEHEGALVFWYEPGGGARLYDKHYSALTQGYYSEVLARVGQLLEEDDLLDAAERSFLALLVPDDKDGVLYEDRHGLSVAEVPQRPNSYILNGWQSALASAWGYWELTGDVRAKDLVSRSAATMAKVLPLYDAAVVANSRYGLTGYVYLRTTETGIADLTVEVPGEGAIGLTEVDEPSRWQNHRVDEQQVNVVLSRASWPRKNVIEVSVDRTTTVQALVGAYDPLSAGAADQKWIDIGEVGPDGPRLEVPWEVVDQVLHPTNFIKEIDGKNTNVYHPIHVQRLAQIAGFTGLRELETWSKKWASYMCRWGDMGLYDGLHSRPVPGGRPADVDVLPVGDLC
ncbi:D-glucuronyl C5-epimerase family protein [Nocardioides sp.]|uniref:D-glucuronyl C5-epimerase family protein n=1 Tax=Nocardioides sp. TaxID=35761 RepID=UPI0027343A71|nr:D-glucuronyl C5-epimerase family protein [Nocardioides sp.]MDP3891211.1 D-glucuronyl C5-epimerase family protein [Nocardioides sp.]